MSDAPERWTERAQDVGARLGPVATWGVGATLALLLFMVIGKSANGSDPRTTRAAGVDLPAAMPVLSELEDGALDGMVAEMEALQADHQVDRVPSAWLEGIYLADAGRFPDVLSFWERYRTYVTEMRDAETRLFQDGLTRRLASEGLSESLLSMRTARALRTFSDDEPRRAEVYERLLAVSDAAIELHELLVDLEEEISYEPAAPGVSREPITEAVPESREVAAKMNRGLDRLFQALEAATGSRVTPRDEIPLALRRGLTSHAETPMR